MTLNYPTQSSLNLTCIYIVITIGPYVGNLAWNSFMWQIQVPQAQDGVLDDALIESETSSTLRSVGFASNNRRSGPRVPTQWPASIEE